MKKIINKITNKFKTYNPPKFLIYLLLFLVVITVFLNNKTLDNDTWFLLSHGKYVLENGIPFLEPFSIHEGFSFVMQQWLSATIFYLVYSIFGKLGLRILVSLIFSLIIYVILKLTLLISNNKFYLASLITFSISVFLIPCMVTRPQIFTYLILLLSMYLFELYIKTRKIKYLYILPILSLLLINLHASMWFMLFLFLLPFIIDSFNFKFKLIHGSNYFSIHIIISVLLMFLVGFINPYHLDAITYIFKSYNIKEINDYIGEMKLVSIKEFAGIIRYFLIFIVLSIYIFYKKNDLKLRYFLLLVGTLYLGISSYKGYNLFILGGIFPLSYYLNKEFLEYKNKNYSKKYIILSIITTVLVGGLLIVISISTNQEKTIYDAPIQSSINYLEKNYSKNIKLYTDYNNGSYALFKGFKVYIDPRAEVYLKSNNKKEDIYIEYYNLQHGLINIDNFLEKYNFDVILLDTKDKIYDYFNDKENKMDNLYKEVYNDKEYVIYERIN